MAFVKLHHPGNTEVTELDASVIDTSLPHRPTVGSKAHILDHKFLVHCSQSQDRTFTCSALVQLVGCEGGR